MASSLKWLAVVGVVAVVAIVAQSNASDKSVEPTTTAACKCGENCACDPCTCAQETTAAAGCGCPLCVCDGDCDSGCCSDGTCCAEGDCCKSGCCADKDACCGKCEAKTDDAI